jgi:acetyl esterase/lipase
VTGTLGPLDRQVAAALAASGRADPPAVAPGEAALERLRARAAALPPAQLPDVAARCRRTEAVSADGRLRVPVQVYAPAAGSGPWPCLYWIYGGGYIFEPVYPVDPRLLRWAAEFGCVVVAPAYRLAPEHPFPAAHDDCWAALRWVHRSAARIGVDRSRVVLGGESAGGGLAAGLALRARDEGVTLFRRLILIYAALDDRHVTASSQVADAPIWSPALSRFAWDCYLGADRDATAVSPYAAAARATDVRGLPPAYLAVGTNDITRDENVDFAQRLMAAGTSVELTVYAGAPHAFELIAPDAHVSRRMSAHLDDVVRRFLASQF